MQLKPDALIFIIALAQPVVASPWQIPQGRWQTPDGSFLLTIHPENKLSIGSPDRGVLLEYEISGYRLKTYYFRIVNKLQADADEKKSSPQKMNLLAIISETLERKPDHLELPVFEIPDGQAALHTDQIIQLLLASPRKQLVLSSGKKKTELIIVGLPSLAFTLVPVREPGPAP